MIERKDGAQGEVVLEIEGSLSGSIAQDFQQLLEEIVEQKCKALILDMGKTTAINSASIGRILVARKKLKDTNGSVRIKGCSDSIYESLTALNMDKLINIEK